MSDQEKLAEACLKPITQSFKERFDSNKRILSYDDYLEIALAAATHHCRDAPTYLRDTFDYYGSYPIERPWGQETRFTLFDVPFDHGRDQLIGQEIAQQQIYRYLQGFARDGRVDRLLLLNGPNGSAKTTLVTCIMRALEDYSTTEAGALYTINWVFPSSRSSSSRIGFKGEGPVHHDGESYAHLPDDDVDARLVCEVRDHPLLLLPTADRLKLLEEAAQRTGVKAPRLPVLLEQGGLCHKCKLIYEALLTAYQGDLSKVLQHVQVERWFVSRAYRRGAVSIGPQLQVDAAERQISADRSLSALPASLQMTTLFEPHGELVDAAGGMLEFSDMLKRPLDAFRYLLSTIETGEVGLNTSILKLNTVLMATTNDTHLQAFREHPEYASFKGRLAVITVPYIRHFLTEQKIYDTRIAPKIQRHLAPHATEAAARWAVLTRLRRPESERYPKQIRDLITQLTASEKAELYATGKVPQEVRSERAEELRGAISDLYHESDNIVDYEGREGASPREIRAVLLAAAQDDQSPCLSYRLVLEHLRELSSRKVEHFFLRRKPQPGGYEGGEELIEVVREAILDEVEDELRAATGLVSEARHLELFERYVLNVRHWVKDEKIFNKITGKDENPDLATMIAVEEHLDIPPKEREDFRRAIIATIAGWAIERPGQALNLPLIFPDHLTTLRASYFSDHREKVARVGRNILAMLSGDKITPDEDAEQATSARSVLIERFGYCESCLMEALADLVSLRYRD